MSICPGPETAGYENLGRIDIERPRLARQDETIVGGHAVPSGAQAVAVDDRAQHGAVRKRDRSRPLPRLGEHGLDGSQALRLLVRTSFLSQGSGRSIHTARMRERPFMEMNSSMLSSIAEWSPRH